MILAEPPDAYRVRKEAHYRQVDVVLHGPAQQPDPWDALILAFLAGHPAPIRFMSAVTRLGRGCRPTNRKQREEVKLEIIRRIDLLVREGVVIRHRRGYIEIAERRPGAV